MSFSSNSKFKPLQVFSKNIKLKVSLSVILTLSFLNLIIGCSYYNVRDVATTSETISSKIADFSDSYNYVVIHTKGHIWHLDEFVLNENEKTISGICTSLNEAHKSLKPRESKRVHQYTKKQEPLNELHFYINSTEAPRFGNEVTFPISEITSISINDENTGRKVANIIGGTVGVIALVAIIVALTKSSCPFIYIKDGNEYQFAGELYPGIITPNMQKDDYLELPDLEISNNKLDIKVTNELKEVQHTDFLQLVEISHRPDISVLMDQNGNPYTFSSIQAPKKVFEDGEQMDLEAVLAKDSHAFLFNQDLTSDNSVRQIDFLFDKPIQPTTEAKLYLRVKNSLWLDYIFGKFNEQFGTYYQEFQKQQQNTTKKQSTDWIEAQHIPLSVYIKTKKGWELVERLHTVGPMAYRDQAISVDLSEVKGEQVAIRLETGFMFWELDYVGIDYSKNEELDIAYILPSQAIDGEGKNVREALTTADRNYFTQPNIGDEVTVSFEIEPFSNSLKRTYFLKNRGYYNYIRQYNEEPNFRKLKLFKEAGAFTDFSKYEYEALMNYEKELSVVVE
ncbi:hypothetical protein [Mangrovimonas sp. YM274]|uniref:hypothetical protein n=1 Tax=Mangrovimonas sp. YM274 TaxID=3070660 RepID=UPI0027DC11CA|nr:hypothetical protein [Mangrovimonas sp. YM274]WMI67322.1 hypothetical protein RBH95_09195 [Mangrovimonas sp. YM274]